MPTGGGGTHPADAGPATASCSGGHPPAPAVSAVRTPTVRTPALWTPTVVPGTAANSQGVRGVRFRSHPDTGRGVRLGQDGGGPAAAVAAPRQDRAGRIARLRWSSGQVDAASGTAVRMPGHRTRPAEHREPARPALRTPATAAGDGDTAAAATLDSRQQDRPPPRNGVRPERDPNVWHRPARPADRQIRSLVLGVDLVGSRRIEPAHVGWVVDLDGSRRVLSDRLDDQAGQARSTSRSRGGAHLGIRPGAAGMA
jgi:hypothetical protein